MVKTCKICGYKARGEWPDDMKSLNRHRKKEHPNAKRTRKPKLNAADKREAEWTTKLERGVNPQNFCPTCGKKL